MDLVLDSLSNLYLLLDLIFVDASGPSSCPTSHYLLTIYITNYCPNQIVNYFDLRKSFYTKQSLKDTCHSSVCTSHKKTLQHKVST